MQPTRLLASSNSAVSDLSSSSSSTVVVGLFATTSADSSDATSFVGLLVVAAAVATAAELAALERRRTCNGVALLLFFALRSDDQAESSDRLNDESFKYICMYLTVIVVALSLTHLKLVDQIVDEESSVVFGGQVNERLILAADLAELEAAAAVLVHRHDGVDHVDDLLVAGVRILDFLQASIRKYSKGPYII